METTFQTLTEAITSVFRSENTSLLSLDRICQALADMKHRIETPKGVVACPEISRRRISSILSSSELFIRAGPLRSCMWALRPNSPYYLSDGALSNCVNQLLTTHGPLKIAQIIEYGDVHGADASVISDFLMRSEDHECDANGVWWFKGQPLPERWACDSVISALVRAFEVLQREASIEDLSRLLSLSVLPQGKKISRRKISRELSRRPDLFSRVSRAKYTLAAFRQPKRMTFPKAPVQLSLRPEEQQPAQVALFGGQKLDLAAEWSVQEPVQPCVTPPECDFFDPVEFFSVGFNSFGCFD